MGFEQSQACTVCAVRDVGCGRVVMNLHEHHLLAAASVLSCRSARAARVSGLTTSAHARPEISGGSDAIGKLGSPA